MKNKCKCGNYEKCVREIGATDSGKLYIIGGSKNHFKCGIVKNQIAKLNNIINKIKFPFIHNFIFLNFKKCYFFFF